MSAKKHGPANREAVRGIWLALQNDLSAAFHGFNEKTFP
jgi:hypothetical protein